ncbi:scavenger receptor class b type-1 sr-b1 [Holotrichia oblita]|uniref:Scavenger receptor class b type-1 sr-b1 n=1 Tax=Holotrichia oblita TaxID=644536 RepID=A0ACB9SSC4_HOLOL|nr:scavenger receptor class b type-1 sr-b1 [Holotrichia oblita]
MRGTILNTQSPNENGVSPPVHHRPRIEQQCEQIFQRASSINKDLIHRMQNAPIVKKKVFGFEIKKIWILATLLLLFSCSLVGTILLWLTNTLDNYIMHNLRLVNGTEAFQGWMYPKSNTYLRVYIFNYTNVEEFEIGIDTRLKVEELGPYVYEEKVERKHVEFGNDGTVTFQNSFSHKFVPNLSHGKHNDVVVVPNLIVLTTAYRTRDLDYWAKVAASMTLGGMKKRPFMKIAAHRYIWGYDDSIYDLAKGFMSLQSSFVADQVGLLSNRNGTVPYVSTLHTGERNMKNYGILSKVNGFDTVGLWKGDCDSVAASDGNLFPPNLIRNKKNISVYLPELCRKLSYHFQEEVLILNNTVPAYRYELDDSVFDSADREPANKCYCDPEFETCTPQGFHNSTTCAFGAPIFTSRPHLYRVDPSQIKVDGLNPRRRFINSYADLHPSMGFPFAGLTRLQINIFAKSYSGFYSMNMFDKDGMYLPLGWVESGLQDQEINRAFIDVIYTTTFTIKQVELALKYITLLTAIITLAAIVIVLKEKIRSYQTSSMRQLNI